MSGRTILLALLSVVILGAVTLVVFVLPAARQGDTVTTGQNLGIVTGDVTCISIAPSRGSLPEITICKEKVGTIQDAASLKYKGKVFEVEPARIRALLSILAQATAQGTTPKQDQTVSEKATVGLSVVFLRSDKTTLELSFAAPGVGGATLLRISEFALASPADQRIRYALVSDEIRRLFETEAVLTWRVSKPLAAPMAAATKLELATDKDRLAIKRLGSRFELMEPIASTADPEAVGKLLRIIEQLSIVQFYDNGPPAGAADALLRPRAKVIISGPGDQAVTLTLGETPADASRRTLFATIARPADNGKSTFVYGVDAAPLLGLSMDPTKLIAPNAFSRPASDVGGMAVELLEFPQGSTATPTFRRSIDGWTENRPDGQAVLLTKERTKDVEQVIDFLATTKASQVLLARPNGAVLLGTLTLSAVGAPPGAPPLASYELLISPDPAAPFGLAAKATGAAETSGSIEVVRVYNKPPGLLTYLLGPALERTASQVRSGGTGNSPPSATPAPSSPAPGPQK